MDLREENACKKEAYEMQLFEFSSRTVCDCVSSIALDRAQESAESLQEALLKNLPHSQAAIKSATKHFLKENTCSAVQELKHLPSAVDEFFAVPSCVLLPEDAPQSTQYTEEEEQQLDKEIEQLKVRAKRACFMEACLRREFEVLQILTTLESEHKDLQQLYHGDEMNESLPNDLRCKVSEIVEVTKAMKSGDKTCFEFPEKTSDITLKDRFHKM